MITSECLLAAGYHSDSEGHLFDKDILGIGTWARLTFEIISGNMPHEAYIFIDDKEGYSICVKMHLRRRDTIEKVEKRFAEYYNVLSGIDAPDDY